MFNDVIDAFLNYPIQNQGMFVVNFNIPVTKIEVKLLELFIKNKGRVLTREQILDRIWDIDGEFVDENTVSVNIRRLRTKIEDEPSNPSFIKTVFGIGYIWGDDN